MTSPRRTPDWLLERIALGELPPDELAAARTRLAKEPDGGPPGRARGGQPGRPGAAAARARGPRGGVPRHRGPPCGRASGDARSFRRLARPSRWCRRSPPRPSSWWSIRRARPRAPRVDAHVPEVTRTKGLLPELVVHRQGAAAPERLADGAAAVPGDVVQSPMSPRAVPTASSSPWTGAAPSTCTPPSLASSPFRSLPLALTCCPAPTSWTTPRPSNASSSSPRMPPFPCDEVLAAARAVAASADARTVPLALPAGLHAGVLYLGEGLAMSSTSAADAAALRACPPRRRPSPCAGSRCWWASTTGAPGACACATPSRTRRPSPRCWPSWAAWPPADRRAAAGHGAHGLVDGLAKVKAAASRPARASGPTGWRCSSITRATRTRRACCSGASAWTTASCAALAEACRRTCASPVLDTCASGRLRAREGRRRRPPFLVDAAARCKGQAILTSSSSEDEASQESDRLGGSFFTHHLVSGLRGGGGRHPGWAGDAATRPTSSPSTRRWRAPSAPRAAPSTRRIDIELAGTGDLVMTDLRATSAGLVMTDGLEGRSSCETRRACWWWS